MIHRLDDKSIYVGNQEVIKGYLGSNLFYNSVDLVFPEPPTEYDTRSLKWAYFFGSGEIINYHGEGVIDELNAGVIKENGLYLEEPINFHNFTTRGGSFVLDMTLERPNDIIDSLQPGEGVPLVKSSLNKGYTASVFVGKDSDGIARIGAKNSIYVYESDVNDALPIGDAEYIHVTHSSQGTERSGSNNFFYANYSFVDGVEIFWVSGSTRSGKQSFNYAEISKDILLYDLKIYSRSANADPIRTLASTNYNGIKDLPFVRTDQL